jgi:hypothetical protein
LLIPNSGYEHPKSLNALPQNKSDEIIEIRRCNCPTEKARLIYDKLGYHYVSYKNENP